ncbi:hypothetical protein [Serinibacter salmoneus]|uniref:hypothetical protein n=1 Tax=Serinibacter salmoneus TaxID=556530 RepID=UPI001473D2F2|nr:hypothetical protein [Serinibacter salmoneus]
MSDDRATDGVPGAAGASNGRDTDTETDGAAPLNTPDTDALIVRDAPAAIE